MMDFAPLTFDHIREWAQLLAVSFDRTPDDMTALLNWLHDGYSVVAWGAWDGDRLAAQYSCRLVDLFLPERASPVPVGMSINMAVHPDYRGQGLIKHVSRPVYDTVMERGGVAGVGFSNADGVRVDLKSKSYGYRVVGKMVSTLVWLKRQPAEALTLTDQWPEAVFNAGCSGTSIQFAHTYPSLVHRFGCHPFRRYQFGVWWEGDHVHGVVIYRPIRLGVVRGAALLGVYGEDQQELLRRWANSMRQTGNVFAQVLTSPHAGLHGMLKTVGVAVDWPLSRTPYYLTAKPLGERTPREIFDFARWDCMGGDVL